MPRRAILAQSVGVIDAAKLICCRRDIAARSCFALGMIAKFEAALHEPWRYRRLFWECGMLGHVLYLEAEAAGVRSTGIGDRGSITTFQSDLLTFSF